MGSKTSDIITVGGGLGGSALAKAMAEHGVRVLVVERERHFKDRVRGEAMHPWGVAEVRALGIYELLHEACGHEILWRDTYLGPERIIHRDLSATTSQRAAEFFVGAKGLGPLATFSGADTWVEHPYRQGVVLIGDAAASDPSFGQGLALTVRDVRVLRDALVSQDDWEVAGHTYATAHDRQYHVIHTPDNCVAELFLGTEPEAEARRARALPLIAQDRSRIPDVYGVGPESSVDETVRRRFFGEEQPPLPPNTALDRIAARLQFGTSAEGLGWAARGKRQALI